MYFAYLNLNALRAENAAPRPSPAQEVLVKGLGALEAGNLEGAEWGARNVLERPDAPPTLKAAAAELLAWTGLAGGSLDTAVAGLDAAPAGVPAGALAQGCVAIVRDGAEAGAPALAAGLCEGSRIIPAAVVARVILDAGAVDGVVASLVTSTDQPEGAAAGLARLQEVLHRAGNYAEAAGVGERGFGPTGSGVIAYNTACSLAWLGRIDEAMTWLATAAGAGWHDAVQLDTDPDLATVREQPGFAEVRALVVAAGGHAAGTDAGAR